MRGEYPEKKMEEYDVEDILDYLDERRLDIENFWIPSNNSDPYENIGIDFAPNKRSHNFKKTGYSDE